MIGSCNPDSKTTRKISVSVSDGFSSALSTSVPSEMTAGYVGAKMLSMFVGLLQFRQHSSRCDRSV